MGRVGSDMIRPTYQIVARDPRGDIISQARDPGGEV
jgi:hypothetical protein